MSRIHASNSGAISRRPIGSLVSSRVAAPKASVANIPTFRTTFTFDVNCLQDDEGPELLPALRA